MNPFEKNSKFKSLGIHKMKKPTLDKIQKIIQNKQSLLYKYQILVTVIFVIILLLDNMITNKLFSFIFLPAVIVLPVLIFYLYNQRTIYQFNEDLIL